MGDITSEVSNIGAIKLPQGELLARYRTRIEMAKKFRDHEGITDTWDRCRDLYKGKQFAYLSDEDRVAVNICFSTINVIGPSIAVNHPKISVWARDEADADRGVIAEAIINYWWQHYRFKGEFRRSVKDYLIYGLGWLKVGYRYKERIIPLSDEEWEAKFNAAVEEADRYAEENPDMAGDLPSDEDIAAGIPGGKPYTVEDCPFVERVSPYDIFVDPEATSMRDARWIAQRLIRNLEDVKRDQRYSASVRKRLQADAEVTHEWRDTRRDNNDPNNSDHQRVTLWEFYDQERQTLSVFAMSGDGFLVKPVPQPYTYGIPFVEIRNYDVPDEFHPMGDLEALLPLQDELNETRSDMIQARKQDLPKHLYRRNALAEDALEALRSDVRNALVAVDDDTPLNEVVVPVAVQSAQPMLFQHSQTILDDVDRVSGVNEFMRGGVPETRRTATEASIIQDAANARAADKLDQIEAVIAEVARRVMALAQQYVTGELPARLVGPSGKAKWFKFNRDDIAGEYDFIVEAGSTQPMNENFRRQQAMQLLQTLQPFLESGLVNIPVLLQHVLRDGFGINNPGRFISDQPPPQEGPDVKLVQTMQYKDVPPDIKAQIEAAAGFQPSPVHDLEMAAAPAGIIPQEGEGEEGSRNVGSGEGADQAREKQLSTQVGYDPATLGQKATERLQNGS